MRYLGLFCFGTLRGSCFVAQTVLELVILLIAGTIGVSPHPEGVWAKVPQLPCSRLAERLSRDGQ